MACIREASLEGYAGIILCYEEGCKFRRITDGSGRVTPEDPPEADCVLQLRRRARDAENARTGVEHDWFINTESGEEVWELKPLLPKPQHNKENP